MKRVKVLIVILNYGTFDMTISLVKELQNKLTYNDYSIMVIDNNSPNESAAVLEWQSKISDFVFYANKVNAGYASGNNIGIRYAIEKGYDYTWILNNDVELVENDILQHMIDVAENNKNIGCVGPKIISLDGSVCAPYCRRPTFWSLTGGIFAENKYRRAFSDVSREVYRTHGCCMLLKNSAMKEVDCMDERTFLYGEEDILAERMMTKGYTCFYDSEVSIIHKGSSTISKTSKNQKKLQIREMNKSLDLYLREYRNFNYLECLVCKSVRSLITWCR